MGQQKAPISFRIISHQKGNTQQQELNHEILSSISYVGITKEDLFICWLQRILIHFQSIEN